MPTSSRAERSKAFVEAYKRNENVEVIPSTQDIHGNDVEEKEELVGAYCRVSTMNEAQVESYELQKAYYEDNSIRSCVITSKKLARLLSDNAQETCVFQLTKVNDFMLSIRQPTAGKNVSDMARHPI